MADLSPFGVQVGSDSVHLIRSMHDALGHGGEGVQSDLVVSAAVFPLAWHATGSRADVAMLVRVCDSCQRRKLVLPEALPLQQPVVRGPFEHVHSDLCCPCDTPIIDRQ
jgi:hypothetical protein